MLKVALVGSPNAGKTTLFNKLTKSNLTIANRPGVTVNAASGIWQGHNCEIIDLPGCHSISQTDIALPYDEQLTAAYIAKNHVDYIINMVDISRLESSLYLTTQLLETNIPTLVVLSKKDLAKKLGLNINTKIISEKLGAPVMLLEATNSNDINNLSKYLTKNIKSQKTTTDTLITQCSVVREKVAEILSHLEAENHISNEIIALNMLASSDSVQQSCQELQKTIQNAADHIAKHYDMDVDIVIAQNRYNFIKSITSLAVTISKTHKPSNNRIDSIVTHQIFGIPILLAVIFAMFWFTMELGGLLQECFTLIGEALFIQGSAALLQILHAPRWAFLFLVNGLGHGITTLIAFIPIVASIFYSMDLLEQSGYMARAAFITDKLMRYLQLPGKAFIPLIISFGCNVPGILATRTLTSQRDRLITGIMTPFMSCNARLAVFAVFASIFFPQDSLKVIISLYFIGVLVAIVTGVIMSKFILPGESAKLIMEMPAYQMPKQKELLLATMKKTKNFCIRVGKYIFISSAVIGVFSQISIPEIYSSNNVIELLGKSITPIFSAIGITSDNWQATVALISGFIAKETTIITLDQLYSHTSSITYIAPDEFLNYLTGVFNEVIGIFYHSNNEPIQLHQQIKQNFASEAAVWSYLLFNLLYMPCISTILTFAKECGWHWAGFSITWSFSIAYIIASLNYSISTNNNIASTIAFILLSIILNLILAKAIVKHTIPKS